MRWRYSAFSLLTIFSVPKPFEGHVGLIQRNALATWSRLEPACEIVLLGNEPGAAEAAGDVGAIHEPVLGHTEQGAPRLDDVFRRVQRLASFDLLCFTNADVLLPMALTGAVDRIRRRFTSCVALGRCYNVDVTGPIDDDWQSWTRRRGEMRPAGGIDYLVFPRDLYDSLPPFALGRAGFDNWLVWEARRRRTPVVDLTAVVGAVHQNHDYDHIAGGRTASYEGTEAMENIRLAGGELHLFNIDDATHCLTTSGLRPKPLAPLRAFPPARWAALRWGEFERFVRGYFRPAGSR